MPNKRVLAINRRLAFIRAIETEKYGKCPKPPKHGGKLTDMIDQFVRVRDDRVIVFGLDRWSRAEIEYALRVVKNLGHKATWT